MTKLDMIEALRKECAENPAANAAFHLFALRKRTRQTITLHSLKQKMKNEGYEFSDEQYTRMLQLLATLGFGKLKTNPKNKIVALEGVSHTLQSIGAVACGTKGAKVETFNKRARFKELVSHRMPLLERRRKQQQKRGRRLSEETEIITPYVTVTMRIAGKPINVEIPPNLTTEEVADLISRIQERKTK